MTDDEFILDLNEVGEDESNPGDLVPRPIGAEESLDLIPAGADDAAALRVLAELRESTQRSRIAFGNRVAAIQRGDDHASELVKEIFKLWGGRFYQLEQDAEKQLLALAVNIEIIEDMTAIRGMGALTAAKIISQIDITKTDTVSALWRYSGYGVGKYWADESGRLVSPVEGTHWITEGGGKTKRHEVVEGKPGWKIVESRDRNIEGWLSPYNKRLKTYLYLAAQGFLRARSPYTVVYYESKSYYAENRADWLTAANGKKVKGGSAHVHAAGMRKMLKIFESHLWEQWREREGLPLRQPYALEKLGHTTKYERADFGWPSTKQTE